MGKQVKTLTFKIVSLFFVFSLILYLVPSLMGISEFSFAPFLNNQEGVKAFEKSILFAVLSSLINVFLGILIATSVSKITLSSRQGSWLSILIVPIIIGNVSIAFIGKILFSNVAFFQSTSVIKFSTLVLIQFWQYGTLFIYLFWLNIINIPKSTLNYADSIKMSFKERFKYLILPACRNLSILLFILNFVLSIYEDAKNQIIFKSSVGTHTELVSQWLNRTYQSNSLINSLFANEKVILLSLVIMLLTLVICLVSSFGYSKGFDLIMKSNRTIFFMPKFKLSKSIVPILLLVFIFVPLLLSIYSTFKGFNLNLTHLITPLLFTFIATFLAVCIAIVVSISLRLGWKETFSSFNSRSLLFFIFLFILQIIPPIIIYVTGFQWLSIVGYQSALSLQILWIIGHMLLILPLIIGFVLVFHFRTTNYEINYMEAHNLSFWNILKDSFFRRYQAEYIFTFLVSFSLIWNESIINNLLSDFIPSFVSEMKMSIEGKGTNYTKGMEYLFVALIIAFMAIFIWRLIINKNYRKKDEETSF